METGMMTGITSLSLRIPVAVEDWWRQWSVSWTFPVPVPIFFELTIPCYISIIVVRVQ